MDTAYISALAALAGSIIGGFSSFATTWVIQNSKFKLDQIDKDKTRREAVYGSFIDEASRLFADAIHNNMHDTSKMVPLYSLVSRMRLFASADIITQAERTMDDLVATYWSPNQDVNSLRDPTFEKMDPLRKFSECCRQELSAI